MPNCRNQVTTDLIPSTADQSTVLRTLATGQLSSSPGSNVEKTMSHSTDDEVDPHVLRKYALLQKLGKGVSRAAGASRAADGSTTC